jgi:hypothetical protein
MATGTYSQDFMYGNQYISLEYEQFVPGRAA